MEMEIPFGIVKLLFRDVIQKDWNVQQDGAFPNSTVTALQKHIYYLINK